MFKELKESLGKALAYFRNLKKLTQKQVGDRLDLHLSWVSAVENGRSVDLKTLRKLCDALEVSVLDVTDLAYADFRARVLQDLRDDGGRLPDQQPVTLADLEERLQQFMRGLEDLAKVGLRFMQQPSPSPLDLSRARLFPAAPQEDPTPPKRRGRPPAAAKPDTNRGRKG